MNAVVASGVPAADWASPFDTAWIDFTKGLGAPLGACLAGSHELIEEAWRWKQMMGGSMRQAGIVAAGALHALDHHVERLAEDHDHARLLAEACGGDPAEVETNIVVVERPDAASYVQLAGEAGILVSAVGPRTVRLVTHLDVSRADAERAAGILARL